MTTANALSPNDPVSVYVTVSNPAEAEEIARALVGERLVACANVQSGVWSLYWWQGKVQSDSEAALTLKTRAGKLDAVVERVKTLHSYECPCIVATPIVAGTSDFLDWIVKETS